MNGVDELRLEGTARRARRLLGGSGRGTGEVATEAAAGGALGAAEEKAIADRIAAARTAEGVAVGRPEAEGVASSLVETARRALAKLDGGGDGIIGQQEAVALEAVMLTRGRPAVRVLGDRLEDINSYPESEIWARLAGRHVENLMRVTAATAAVQVTDTLLPDRQWVQGTAFLIAPTLAITNRHVLFPPIGGTRIARRVPGTTTARMKGEYDVRLDFAFDSGTPRSLLYRITGIPFVAADADPVDAALLAVEPAGGNVAPLPVSREDIFDIDRLYIVGHPGRLPNASANVLAVFGQPDERKRVSFGNLLDQVEAGQVHVVHDASTIGGYSGSSVVGFADAEVRALHYWGDAVDGNRAIASDALRRHEVMGPMIP